MLYDIWKEESEIKYGSEQRLELRKLLENYRTNPSNGNRHEQAVCDFIESSSTTSLIRVLEGMKEKLNGVPKEYLDQDYFYGYTAVGAYELAQQDLLKYLSEQIELIRKNI